MRWKTFISYLVLIVLPFSAIWAGERDRSTSENAARPYPRFTFGVESSYALTFLNFSHFNFISSDGSRRDERAVSTSLFSNGQFLVHGGVNVSRNVNISIYTGYSGIYRGERMIPVSLRFTWLSGTDPLKNRWMAFCSAGGGINDITDPWNLSAEGRIGGGYRFSLNRSVKLDVLLAFQECYTHPRAYESDVGNYVPAERLRRNDAYISAVTIGLALTF